MPWSGHMSSEARTLADFAGDWVLDRVIDPVQGPSGRFEGTARWTPDATGLLYEEQGTLQLEGHAAMAAHRRYHWHPDLWITFEDGRRFHQVPALGGQSRHWCDPDTYLATYDFEDWPQFSVRWSVHGPQKDYQMTTVYSKA